LINKSDTEFFWKVDNVYRNTGSKNNPDDEFIRKVWVDIENSSDKNANWTIPNSGGIRGLAKGKNKKKIKSIDKSAIFCITVKHSTGSHNPWEDSINVFNGQIRYWGDAKSKLNKGIDDFDGNKYLRYAYDNVLKGQYKKVPPILHFTNERQGEIRFNGLCVIEQANIRWTIDDDKRILNYQFILAILDCDEVSTDWIKSRAILNSDNHPFCPDVWKTYIKTGNIKRLQAWRSKIRSKVEQIPSKNSREEKFLEHIKRLDPELFEKSIVYMLEKNNLVHSVEQTRFTRDGGMDMIGKFTLPHPFGYDISFKGEVKRHKGTIGPGVVSRLVARLGRGEYGLFFTTSYYTEQAQKEVIKDKYPVKLFSGVDLYNLFDEADMIRNGKLVIS